MRGSMDYEMNRRGVLVGTAATVAASGVPTAVGAEVPKGPDAAVMTKVSLKVNGKTQSFELDTRTSLLDPLREHLHLTGTKKGCDHGQCGACTVIVDGRRINSCLTLAVMHEGDEITTIEGLGHARPPAPDAGGLRQARRLPVRLLHAGPDLLGRGGARRDQGRHPEPRHRRPRRARRRPPTTEMRERMSGNICRCGAYSNIVEAMAEVAGRHGMKPFTYERAEHAGRGRRRRGRARRAPSSSPAAPTCST